MRRLVKQNPLTKTLIVFESLPVAESEIRFNWRAIDIHDVFHMHVDAISREINIFSFSCASFAPKIPLSASNIRNYLSDATFQRKRQIETFSNLVRRAQSFYENPFVQRTVKHPIKVCVLTFGDFGPYAYSFLFFFPEKRRSSCETHCNTPSSAD